MPWLQLKLRATHQRAALLAMALEEAGALAVSIEDAGDEPRFEQPGEPTPLWSQNWVTGLFPESTDVGAILARLEAWLPEPPPTPIVDLLTDQDWSRSWKAHYRPIEITPRLWICPSWLDPPRPDAINILLDPGLAFGTGSHPTTALCLRWLAQGPLAGKLVLDYGCGSGILAIAALKLGAARAHGVDSDPVALAVSEENATRNGVAARLGLYRPDELPPLQADVVLANILANPLIALAASLTNLVRPGGHIVLCGLLCEQADEVSVHYAKEFVLTKETLDGWVLLQGEKRNPAVPDG